MAQFKDLFTELRRDTGLSQEDFAALVTRIIRAYRTLLLSAPKNILTTVDKSGIKSYPFVCIVWTGVSKYKERNSANL